VPNAVGRGNVERVAGEKADALRDAAGGGLGARMREHLVAEIQAQDLAAESGPAQELEREVAGPGREVEDASDTVRPGHAHGRPSPAPVQPERQDPIQQVVPWADLGEHPGDAGGVALEEAPIEAQRFGSAVREGEEAVAV
jgi:hypothetical protein